MPKLSTEALAKRFKCPYCEKTLRGRQGLSGHIQFKHGRGQQSSEMDAAWLVRQIGRIEKVFGTTMAMPEADVRARMNILKVWPDVIGLANTIGITLNRQDFKNYFLTRLALIHYKESLGG